MHPYKVLGNKATFSLTALGEGVSVDEILNGQSTRKFTANANLTVVVPLDETDQAIKRMASVSEAQERTNELLKTTKDSMDRLCNEFNETNSNIRQKNLKSDLIKVNNVRNNTFDENPTLDIDDIRTIQTEAMRLVNKGFNAGTDPTKNAYKSYAHLQKQILDKTRGLILPVTLKMNLLMISLAQKQSFAKI